jgi:NAD(P)-dependent dehydrogenase (short-subunit alcohol dehydrogenase family)
MPNFSVKDKVILITGAGGGIGHALARGLLRDGAKVVGAGRRLTTIEPLTNEFGRDRALGIQADVSQEIEVEALVKTALEHFGRVDAVINNAAITPNVTIRQMEYAHWQDVLTTNLSGTFLLSRAVIPVMERQGNGRIINMTSSQGVRGTAGLAAYAASKAAIINFTGVLHAETAKIGIRTVAVAPGLIETQGMRQAVNEAHIAQVTSSYPGGKPGQPEDLVGLIEFLVSDAADHLSGTTVFMRP